MQFELLSRPFKTLMRLLERIERMQRARAKTAHGVANYEVGERNFCVFFMIDGNYEYFCQLERRFAYEAETDIRIIKDGIAWCRHGELPRHARPMDKLPSKDESSFKYYR